MANTTYEELYRKVLLRLDKKDGRALLTVMESVNDAHKDIARVWDVDELIIRDTTSGATVASQRLYHMSAAAPVGLALTRPKDILSLILYDTTNSRKLVYRTPRWVDENMPYPEGMSTGKPSIYTRRGNNLDLLPIPDAAYPLYITYSRWPSLLTDDADETDYVDLDDVIIDLATERANAILQGITGVDWTQRARYFLGISVGEDRDRPDELLIAQPFNTRSVVTTEYWKDPFVRRNPNG